MKDQTKIDKKHKYCARLSASITVVSSILFLNFWEIWGNRKKIASMLFPKQAKKERLRVIPLFSKMSKANILHHVFCPCGTPFIILHCVLRPCHDCKSLIRQSYYHIVPLSLCYASKCFIPWVVVYSKLSASRSMRHCWIFSRYYLVMNFKHHCSKLCFAPYFFPYNNIWVRF